MRNIRLVLEYNGAQFHGWQEQPGVRTVQSELTRVLEMVMRRKVQSMIVAGRTDAGVHARGQVVNFLVDEEEGEAIDLYRISHSVSRILRGEVSILKAEFVPFTFNSRRDAIAKQYSYQLLLRETPATIDYDRVWHVGTKLNLEVLKQQAALVIGQHDFTSFRGAACNSKNPIRQVYESEFIPDGQILTYRIVGRGFLKHMVRNIVGTLVALSRNALPHKSFTEIIAQRDRRTAGTTAPAKALTLDWVRYGASNGGVEIDDDE